jgi:hypothetical protein
VTVKSSGWAALALVVVALAGAFVLLWNLWPSPPPAAQRQALDESRADSGAARRAPSLPAATASPPPPPVARPPVPAPPPSATEPALIATLRLMVDTAPQQSLDLAREARRRFGSSPHAPERDWIVVKSLVNLRRFHEARDEARALVAKYPDSESAQDVRRHLLVYPLDQPSREEMQQRDAGAP